MGDLIGPAIIVFLFGFGIGLAVNDVGMRGDCEALGKFRSSGEVYVCHLQKEDGGEK